MLITPCQQNTPKLLRRHSSIWDPSLLQGLETMMREYHSNTDPARNSRVPRHAETIESTYTALLGCSWLVLVLDILDIRHDLII